MDMRQGPIRIGMEQRRDTAEASFGFAQTSLTTAGNVIAAPLAERIISVRIHEAKTSFKRFLTNEGR